MQKLPNDNAIHDALDFIPYSCHYCGYRVTFRKEYKDIVIAECEMMSSDQCYSEIFDIADILKHLKLDWQEH